MRYFLLLAIGSLFIACQTSTPDETLTASTLFSVEEMESPIWEKNGLRLIPITASDNFVASQASVAQYQVLEEAIQEKHFRITEKKPYGRFEDDTAVNALTVQNKTEHEVFLMAGEVVQGGNQDRVIAEDQIIAARDIQDIPVFCVERGRWTYEGDHAIDEIDKKVFAFRGYYSVASTRVRQAVASGNQHKVWDNVASVTDTHKATSSTSAYAGLESDEDFVRQRTQLKRFFSDKLDKNERIVGFVAVHNDRLIGADIFGHPDLLNRQFAALVTSYATDAITGVDSRRMQEGELDKFIAELSNEASSTKGLRVDGQLIHYSKLP